MEPTETLTLTAEKMVAGGDCLAHHNGKNIFIPQAIPGEVLEVRITRSLRDFDRAEIVRILSPSPYRVQSVCPLYGCCGGCNMQHIAVQKQQELRKTLLADCFLREGVSVPVIQVISDSAFGYRARMQLHDGGLFARESNTTVPLNRCPVATEAMNSYFSAVPQNVRPRGRVQIFSDARVVADASHMASHTVVAAEEAVPEVRFQGGGKRRVKDKVKKRFSGTIQDAMHTVRVLLAGKTVQFDVRGFFQSNLAVLEKAIGAVCFGLQGKHVLDMYSGVGTFSVFLADYFEHVTLVEHNRDALVHAEINMAGKKHESYGVSGERFIKENCESVVARHGPFDAVVIDPPRSGMEKSVCSWLCSAHIPVIRSVSCDPATQARDVSKLIKAGYTLTSLFLLDFYPQTAHIESLACLEYHG